MGYLDVSKGQVVGNDPEPTEEDTALNEELYNLRNVAEDTHLAGIPQGALLTKQVHRS